VNQVYITGDSFCAYRNLNFNDWPALLAQRLNLQLSGIAFPGCGWWPIRAPLIEHVKEHGSSTKLFVICHTDCHRPLSAQQVLYGRHDTEMHKAWETYYRHFQDNEIDYWVLNKWYREVNDILCNYHVIHLQCFMSTSLEFSNLRGCRIVTSLSECSLSYAPSNVTLIEDKRRNHFSPEENFWLADQIFKCYTQWVADGQPDRDYYLNQI
jgi:hypothetical protein